MKSNTWSVFSLGKGMTVAYFTEQKVNARSSTDSELVGFNNRIRKILWNQQFLECQGFKVKINIIYQDNISTIKLQKNGKSVSGKRTWYYDIKYFYVTDLTGRDKVQLIYCPTDDILGDYMTKLLVGSKFVKFRDLIMIFSNKYHRVGQQECVGELHKNYWLE